MERDDNLKKEKYNSFLNLIKREDVDESYFIEWLNELHEDLSSFWKNMND